AVRHAVHVRVERTADLVHHGAGRRVGTLIDAVEHSIAVRVGGTASGVDRGAGGRVGALIDAVGHAVVIRVDGASGRIDVSAARSPRNTRSPSPPWIALSVKR